MNKAEVAALLTIAGGFDQRKVDDVMIASWSLVPAIQSADFEDAKAAVIAHVTGPNRKEYLTVGHVTDATQVSSRQTKELVASDVRSARARGLVPRDWPEWKPVTAGVRSALEVARDDARVYAMNNPLELDEGSWEA